MVTLQMSNSIISVGCPGTGSQALVALMCHLEVPHLPELALYIGSRFTEYIMAINDALERGMYPGLKSIFGCFALKAVARGPQPWSGGVEKWRKDRLTAVCEERGVLLEGLVWK